MMMLKPNPIDGEPVENAKQPPHDLTLEQAVLGAILIDNGALERTAGLEPGHFFDPLHANLFETMATLISSGKLASPITVKSFFENAAPIDAHMTVPQYIGTLAARAPTISGVRDYTAALIDMARRRSIIIIGEDMVAEAYDATADGASAAIIEEAEKRLFDLVEKGVSSGAGAVPFSDALRRAVEQASHAHHLKGRIAGLSTGLVDLDDKLGGMAKSDLIILAGRPSMGKTALAVNIAWHVATCGHVDANGVATPAPVGFFSLEMKDEQLATRVAAACAGISSEKIRRGMMSDEELERLARTANDISYAPLYIDERGGITIAQLSTRARNMRRRYGIELLVVDYLQLLAGGKKGGDGNRVQEITEITTGLKSLAKELNIPILALSQLSRQVESRTDKRPQLSDLRESGSIEQDADVVMFVYREEYYLERTKPDDQADPTAFSDWQRKFMAAQGIAEAIIGKQRHGPTGTVKLAFDGSVTRFSNLAIGALPHG